MQKEKKKNVGCFPFSISGLVMFTECTYIFFHVHINELLINKSFGVILLFFLQLMSIHSLTFLMLLTLKMTEIKFDFSELLQFYNF